MPNPSLYAPWRMDYIRSLEQGKPGDCFICQAVAATTNEEKRERLVLWSSDHSIVIINKFPYTNGHILVSPKAHKAELEQLNDAEQADLTRQTIAVIALLKRAVSAQGFNVGINLGRCAG